MEAIILVVHLFIAIALVGIILIQRSEGGALGIGGGGGGGGMMSSRGAANALTRTTVILAAAFFCTSLTLTMLARNTEGPGSVVDSIDEDALIGDQPAEPAPPLGDDGLLPSSASDPVAPMPPLETGDDSGASEPADAEPPASGGTGEPEPPLPR